jgi:hypothetical protein
VIVSPQGELLSIVQTGRRALQVSCSVGTGVIASEVKCLGREDDHLSASWFCPVCLQGVCNAYVTPTHTHMYINTRSHARAHASMYIHKKIAVVLVGFKLF